MVDLRNWPVFGLIKMGTNPSVFGNLWINFDTLNDSSWNYHWNGSVFSSVQRQPFQFNYTYFEGGITSRAAEIAKFKLNGRHLRSGRVGVPLGRVSLLRAKVNIGIWHPRRRFKARQKKQTQFQL
jgi:hypothetical protein